jgi:tetratricopeptide (TPR) repeat protein
MKFWILPLMALLMAACTSMHIEDNSNEAMDPRVRAEQEGQIRKADEAYEAMNFTKAEADYAQFQTQFPTSIYYQKAQLGQARALSAQEKWAEAAELYRKSIEATRQRQPEIAAQALYEISYCYENLGDEARVLASLQDALLLKDHLLPEQALAEIPARMAASYNRMGRSKEAEQYYRRAEAGIQQVRASQNSDNLSTWLSRTYYRMGVYSTNQISYENLQASLDTLKMVQTFSLRSAEEGGDPWSKMASQGLIMNYRDLWRVIQQFPLNKAMDPGAAKREQIDRQVAFTGQMLTLINDLKVYRSPERGGESADASELYMFLGKLEKQAQGFLYSIKERNPLTPEAEKRGGLKK